MHWFVTYILTAMRPFFPSALVYLKDDPCLKEYFDITRKEDLKGIKQNYKR